MKPTALDRARRLPLATVASLAAVLAVAGCSGHPATPTAAAPSSIVPPVAADPAVTTPATSPSIPIPTSITPTPTTPAGPARCHTADLTARLRELDAAAGSHYAALVLTNRSTRTCRVYGYGGVQLLDAAHRPLPTHQVRVRIPPPNRVLLRPGASAYSLLHWSVVPAGTESVSVTGRCEPTPTYLLVTPPDETQPITIAWSAWICSHGRIAQTAYAPGTAPTD
jgi:hypothetical protein